MNTPSPRSKKPPPPAPLPGWLDETGQLRTAALTFASTLLGCAAVVGASHWLLSQESGRETEARQGRDGAARAFSQMASDKLEIGQFEPRFVALRELGLIGPERRLDWIEAIKRIQAERRLAPLTYEFAPQQAFEGDAGLQLAQYRLRGSRMSLHMDLLHEMDLLNFLDDLKRSGFFTAQACRLQRSAAPPGMQAQPGMAQVQPQPQPVSHLSADCTLNWFSLERQQSAAAAPAAQDKDKER